MIVRGRCHERSPSWLQLEHGLGGLQIQTELGPYLTNCQLELPDSAPGYRRISPEIGKIVAGSGPGEGRTVKVRAAGGGPSLP